MKRVMLLIVTNLAVLFVLNITLHLLGVDRLLQDNNVDLNINALLIFSAVFGMSGSFISLLLSKWMAIHGTGARIIREPSNAVESWLVETVRNLARASKIGMPDVAIYRSPDPNAFATGARRDHALVAVSSGLLDSMNQDEVEGVLAHEVSHIANGDMITLTLIQGVLNTFVIFLSRIAGHIVDRAVFKTERGYGPAFYITTIFAQIAIGILASMIVYAVSRKREFRADSGAADLVGSRKMIAALKRLQAGSRRQAPLPQSLAAMGISGNTRHGLVRLFMTHPPLEERIVALEQYIR